MNATYDVVCLARLFVRELRRHAKIYGKLPPLDTTDEQLQRSWIRLSRTIEHNAKAERSKLRAELRGAA